MDYPKNSVNINKRYTDKISIGYLGRFETQKGIPSILDASVILKNIIFISLDMALGKNI